MDPCNLEGYTLHAKQMSRRVRDRRSHPELSAIDKIVIEQIREFVNSKGGEARRETLRVLDAGCGSGERMKIILERLDIPREMFHIVGIDGCEPLLVEAQTKECDGVRVYDDVMEGDLLSSDLEGPYDIILCLFSVINNVGSLDIIRKLGSHLDKGGIIILDSLHPAVIPHFFTPHPHLVEKFGSETGHHYYTRQSDKSFGSARVFTFAELSSACTTACFDISAAWDILTYRGKRGKGALDRPYVLVAGSEQSYAPGSEHPNAWPNSILLVLRKHL